MRNFFFIVWVSILVILDMVSKLFFVEFFSFGIFSINPVLNRGSSFSLFSSFDFYNVVMFVLSLVVIVACSIIFIRRRDILFTKYYYFFLFFVSGVIGNGIDRALFGGVRDFLSIPYFAIVNLADIYLSSSILILIYFYISENKLLKERSQ